MKRISLFLSLLLMPLFASAKTLTKMVILPPSTGYWIFSATNTGTIQLSLFCTYDDASTDTTCTGAGGTVTWFAEYPSSMTVNSSGLATGTGANVPVFNAPIKDGIGAYNGTVFAHASINVNQYALTCINIRPETSGSNIVMGSTILLSAEDCTPESGSGNPNVDGPAIGDFPAWTSSNTGVATVDNVGLVTGVSAGTAVITATLPSVTQTRTVTVTNPTPTLTTYYVRPGGGNRTQCTGLANVDYPGSGSGVACAVNNPMYCFTDDTSTSIYTGLVHAGDICMVAPPTSGTQYPVAQKSPGVAWNTTAQAPGAIVPPSGTPAHPTKMISSTTSTCEVADPLHLGTCAGLISWGAVVFELYDVQNFDVEGFDLWSGVDCNHLQSESIDFNCPAGSGNRMAMLADQFTSNFTLSNSRVHGYYSSIEGTPGPGTVWNHVSILYMAQSGISFDNPFGFNGNRTYGFSFLNSYIGFAGFTEELPKPLTGGSVVRDGSGHLNVTFPSGSLVNYIAGTNFVLTGATPSDLNGTYPVTSVNFNQNTASITAVSFRGCNDGYNTVGCADFSTTATPAFNVGDVVNLTTSSPIPSFLNGPYEVLSINTTPVGFTVAGSIYTRPGWMLSGSFTGTGSASTALSLVATATGSSETASVLGIASHVTPAHRGMDQADTGFSNGDCIGTGNNTKGPWISIGSQFHRCAQDGWDMLHSAITQGIFQNNFSEGNEGQPAKLGIADSAIITDNIISANAGANMAADPNLPPEYNQYLTTFFRAGDGFLTANEAWATMIISNNTFMNAQNVGWDDFYDSELRPLPFTAFIFQNNLVVGFTDNNNPSWNASLPTIYYSGSSAFTPVSWSNNNNMAWNSRNAPGGGSGNNWTLSGCPNITCVPSTTNPNIVNLAGEIAAVLPNWNMNLVGGSPAIGAGIANSFTPSTDYNGTATTSPPVIGALNFAAGPAVVATPTASPAAGTYGSTQSVTLSTTTGGATICYTIDGSTPTATTPGTCSHGTTYSTAITVAVTTTINAIGTLSGDTNSSLGTFPYTILVPIQNVVVSGRSVFGGKSSLQ